MMQIEAVTSHHSMAIPGGIPRPVEVFIALLALLLFSPLLLLSAAATALTSRGPVIFRQRRVGRGGQIFVLYKLRTMHSGRELLQITAADDVRVTNVGRLLRKMKLDELPELWNVVKGDMSLVGPRPEVPRYVDPENSRWRFVLEARPGLTDPVTLYLRNEEALLAELPSDRERFYLETLQPYKLEGYSNYLRGRSWRSDVSILWKTSVAIVLHRNAPPPKPLIELKEPRKETR
jgi:lipopolysaccharide/colanic/teichoic acid biosynthesis glycosyltransferase